MTDQRLYAMQDTTTGYAKSASHFSKHKFAVFVYGAGSGFGKSTLAVALTQELASLGLSVSHFSEECAPELPAFHTYVQQVRLGHGDDATSLLESCSEFIADLRSSDADAIVLDSLLPCWDWLYSAGADDSVISAFTEKLNDLLRTRIKTQLSAWT